MAKKDNSDDIRIGNAWDFKNFFPRPDEKIAQRNGKLSNDPFTRSFLNLHKALKKNEEMKKEKDEFYPFFHKEEKQGIFIMDATYVNIFEYPFYFYGTLDSRQRNNLHGYAREMRKFLTATTSLTYAPKNIYFSNVTFKYETAGKNKQVKMPAACAMNLDEIFWCYLIPLQDSLERVVYQIAETERTKLGVHEEVLGAGFFYTGKHKELALMEVKEFLG